MNDKSLYYKGFDAITEIDSFFDNLKEYAELNESGNSVYILNRPLGDKKYSYEYEKAAVILIPKHKMLFLDYGNNEEAFEEYVDEFIDDAGHISDKYDYMQVLGRTNKWRREVVVQMQYGEIQNLSLDRLLDQIKLPNKESVRKGEFLISLLTGSINDIQKTGLDYPETLLERIKRKIVLFDGDQTRFIYDEPHQRRITIRGLAGTGKTELLLHKIKEIYTHNSEVKIAFTCHNKILAENLRTRIPEFFNFMKVQEQIKVGRKIMGYEQLGI
ncbi:MAG: DEAD/DEAH box helicase family protein [Lachnospiraceae bacterium]|nr:DEAD/DEAH box helicase family protein [Lachnospiraceae bacterium]